MMDNTKMRWLGSVVAMALVATAAGCANTGTKPDDMSAAAHGAEAAKHEKVSEAHADQFDPGAVATRRIGVVDGLGFEDFDTESYNPTERHLDEANAHHSESEEHRAAAAALRNFEEAECRGFPSSTRAVCPLLGHVIAVADIEDGVRIQFAPDVNLAATAAHVRCHIAFGRTQGREGMAHCPMYLKGVQAIAVPPDRLDMTVDDDALLAELRRRAASHVATPAP